ncbi:MAG: hypothetical protein KH216_04445 [Clostridiales bacterium]|nr:hypothetical protein [Clostridiales bacterium]
MYSENRTGKGFFETEIKEKNPKVSINLEVLIWLLQLDSNHVRLQHQFNIAAQNAIPCVRKRLAGSLVHLHLHKKVYSGADDMNLSDICAPKAPVSQKGGSDSKPL